jgi:hypothetical protein
MGEVALFPSLVDPLYSAAEHHHSVTCDWRVMTFHHLSPRQDLMASPFVVEAGRLDVLHSVRNARGLYRF